MRNEIDELRAQLAGARTERDEAREKSARRGVLLWQVEQQRDRLEADLKVVCERESNALDEYAKHRLALEAERDELKRAALLRRPSGPCPHEQERDRLLAALMAVVGDGGVDGGEHYECRGEACERARAVLRAKAGLP